MDPWAFGPWALWTTPGNLGDPRRRGLISMEKAIEVTGSWTISWREAGRGILDRVEEGQEGQEGEAGFNIKSNNPNLEGGEEVINRAPHSKRIGADPGQNLLETIPQVVGLI